ncbi:MAG: hypothetical protein D6B26_05735 [Spirochaetaceae bacterium]|nr:MAG: hypothetical protein D6B26_05735 [Spirochaetaceae bacterium]
MKNGRYSFKSSIITALLILIALQLLIVLPASANPFTSGRPTTETPPETQETRNIPEGLSRITGKLPSHLQKQFNSQLSELISAESANLRSILLAAAIAFAYGLVHATLPGHRKTLLLGYFLTTNSKPITGVIAGTMTALLHAASGATVVLVAWFILSASVSAALDNATATIHKVTAGGAVLLGAIILANQIREAIRKRRNSGGAGDTPAAHDDQAAEKPPGKLAQWLSRGKMLPAIVLSATIPCPGSAMILLFALAVGNLLIGLVSIISFATGMGIVLSIVCVIAIYGKQQFIQRITGKTGRRLHEAVETIAAIAIIAAGLFWII